MIIAFQIYLNITFYTNHSVLSAAQARTGQTDYGEGSSELFERNSQEESFVEPSPATKPGPEETKLLDTIPQNVSKCQDVTRDIF